MSYWVSLSEVALDCRFCLIYGLLYMFQIYLDLDFAFSETQRQCCLKREAIVPNFNDTEYDADIFKFFNEYLKKKKSCNHH
jgi:arginyl-tRNA--protein-N-Asp/Glu arginylyltransferase